MLEIKVTLPDDAELVLGVSRETVGEELRIAGAMKLYEMGRISSGKAAEFAGVPKAVFLTRLADYGLDTFAYTEADLRQDAGLA